MGLKILSPFDGMACGMIAFLCSGYEVERYVAFEIDKYAIKTAQHNFPIIEEMGDVFNADFTQYKDFDFLVGGSPCTYWSIAQTKNRETVASGMGWELFSQYVRALHDATPRFFIYENNKSMSKDIRKSISETFGFEPIMINSALVSAQNRERLYWVGIRQEDGSYAKADIEQPEDMGILLKDVLDHNQYQLTLSEKEMDYMVRDSKGKYTDRWSYLQKPEQNDKALCITANTHKSVPYNICAEPVPVCVAQRGRNPDNPTSRVAGEPTEQRFEARTDGKSNTVTTVQKDCMVAEPIPFNPTDDGKSHTLTSTYYKISGVPVSEFGEEMSRQRVAIKVGALPRPNGELSKGQAFQIYSQEGKSVTLCANGGGAGGKTGLYAVPLPTDDDGNIIIVDGPIKETVYKVENGLITVKGRQYPIKLNDGYYIIRKLTVSECMRLQTVPEWYEFPVSNTQAYKMLGNGWTCQVIMHLINNLPIYKEDKNESI